jgi:hypothetical protein
MTAHDANAEKAFQELNIPKLKVMAAKIAKEQPSINRITVFHGRDGEASYILVLNVDDTYSGPTDSMVHLDTLRKAYKEPKKHLDDWGFFVEKGDEIPEEFIVTDYRCVLYEKPRNEPQPLTRWMFGRDLRDRWGVNNATLADYVLNHRLKAYEPETIQAIDVVAEKDYLMNQPSYEKDFIPTITQRISTVLFRQDEVSEFEVQHQLNVITDQSLQSSTDSKSQIESGQSLQVDERPSPITSEQRLNGKKEIAKFLRVSPDTLDRYREDGMPVECLNGSLWQFPSVLNNWMLMNSKKKN